MVLVETPHQVKQETAAMAAAVVLQVSLVWLLPAAMVEMVATAHQAVTAVRVVRQAE